MGRTPSKRPPSPSRGQCNANCVSVHVTMTTVVRHDNPLWRSAVTLLLLVSSPRTSAAEPSASAEVAPVSGNGLWDDLVGKCDGPRNTMDCVRSRLYNYVDHTLEADFNVTDGLTFTRNSNDYEAMCPGDNSTGSNRQARAHAEIVSNRAFHVRPTIPSQSRLIRG